MTQKIEKENLILAKFEELVKIHIELCNQLKNAKSPIINDYLAKNKKVPMNILMEYIEEGKVPDQYKVELYKIIQLVKKHKRLSDEIAQAHTEGIEETDHLSS